MNTPSHPPTKHRLLWRWLIVALLALTLPLSTLPATERNGAYAAHDIAHAVRALSRAAVAIGGRSANDPADACRRILVRPVRDAMTPAS